ncbi:MAG: hypothetical protein M3Z65_01310 [Chloroflexota bacterium]|nr:hypothetical protein [Chloroflexota bacterium]
MTSGTLTDLDPPDERERSWPFYVVWVAGGLIVAAVLAGYRPASLRPAGAPPAEPAAAPAVPTIAPVRIIDLPLTAPFRVIPPPVASPRR